VVILLYTNIKSTGVPNCTGSYGAVEIPCACQR